MQSAQGDKAFLKALDYKEALRMPDPARALQAMTAAYVFERDILEKCQNHKLSRVVRAIAAGKINAGADPSDVVEYLIFELADGDVRSYLDPAVGFDNAWSLRALHQMAAALDQLHWIGIAHQDVKPSNVLVFDQNSSKLADLGRATDKGVAAPHDGLGVAGDKSYAPLELLYGYIDPDWDIRRRGCDAYLFGSMVVFFFTQLSATSLILSKMDDAHHWKNWGGSFDQVLPYVQHAFARGLDEFGEVIAEPFRDELVEIVRQLCNPDPRLRGHPRTRSRADASCSLYRYVSIFDRLAAKAEYLMRHP